jgi:hypothetical protein
VTPPTEPEGDPGADGLDPEPGADDQECVVDGSWFGPNGLLVDRVIRGDFGNGPDRITALGVYTCGVPDMVPWLQPAVNERFARRELMWSFEEPSAGVPRAVAPAPECVGACPAD